MLIAVTGGTGFIGRPLVERLVASGHTVRLLSRSAGKIEPRPGVEPVPFDPEKGLTADLHPCKAVINLAGAPILQRWTAANCKLIFDSRVKTTEALVEAARRSGSVTAMVSASAVGFYGHRGDEELDEASPPGSDFTAKVCQAWEEAARPAERAGIRLSVIRIGIVLHTDGGPLQKVMGPFRFGAGGPIGSGQQWVSWIHRDDLLSLLLHALRSQHVDGVLNGTAPGPVRNAELARAVGKAMRRPAVLKTPAAALRLVMGDVADMLLTGQRVLPHRTVETGFGFAYPTLEKAFQQLFPAKAAV